MRVWPSPANFVLVRTALPALRERLLAEGIATLLLTEFQVPWLRLRLNKQGAVRGVRDVGVIIERGSRG